MRRKILSVPVFFILLLLFNSCRKEVQEEKTPANTELISKVNDWLDEQKPAGKAVQTANIDLLKGNLDFSGMRIEQSAAGEKIIIIPVQEGLAESKRIDKKAAPYLLLIMNNAREIRKGNVVLYRAANGREGERVPENTFYNILNTGKPECDAGFTYLDVTGRKMHELEYENEKLKAFRNFREDTSTTVAGRATNCVDWYWVTTYYDSDGLVIGQDWEYVGTTCQGEDCEDPYLAMVCPMDASSGGGSGSPAGYEYAVTKSVNWVVEEAQNQSWYVKSYETLTGLKVQGEPGGGHFTENVHNSSSIFNTGGQNIASWQQLQVVPTLVGEGAMTRTFISGRITFDHPNLPDREVNNKFRQWAFFQEFP